MILEIAVGAAGIFAAMSSGRWMGRLAAGQLQGFVLFAYRTELVAGVAVGGVLFFVAAIIEENRHVNLSTAGRAAVILTASMANVLLVGAVLLRG